MYVWRFFHKIGATLFWTVVEPIVTMLGTGAFLYFVWKANVWAIEAGGRDWAIFAAVTVNLCLLVVGWLVLFIVAKLKGELPSSDTHT